MKPILRAAAVLLIAATPALAQVKLETGLAKGRTLNYEVTQSLEIEQRTAPDAEPSLYKSDIDAALRFNIVDVDATGSARVECTLAAFKSRYEDPSGPTSVNFDMKKDENPAGLALLESALIDATISFTVSPKGAISDMAGLDDVVSVIQKTPEATVQLFGFFRAELLSELFSKVFSAEGGVGDHAIGDAWSDSRRVALGSGGALEITTKCTLASADKAVATITGDTTFELYVPRERGQDVPAVTLNDAGGDMRAQWDLKEGALLTRIDKQHVAMDWNRASEDENNLRIIQTQRSESRIERK
jgi:hypothetical protein